MEDSGSSDLGSNPGGTTTASLPATLFFENVVFLGWPKLYVVETFRAP